MTGRSQIWDGAQWIDLTGSNDTTFLDTLYLRLSGGTLTGLLQLNAGLKIDNASPKGSFTIGGTPLGDEGSGANKVLTWNSGTGIVSREVFEEWLPLTGGTMTGALFIGFPNVTFFRFEVDNFRAQPVFDNTVGTAASVYVTTGGVLMRSLAIAVATETSELTTLDTRTGQSFFDVSLEAIDLATVVNYLLDLIDDLEDRVTTLEP